PGSPSWVSCRQGQGIFLSFLPKLRGHAGAGFPPSLTSPAFFAKTMSADTPGPKRKRHTGKIIALSLLLILLLAAYFVYNNFNRLVSEALIKSFDSNIVSDVYELKFEKLRINVLEGSVRVVNVV